MEKTDFEADGFDDQAAAAKEATPPVVAGNRTVRLIPLPAIVAEVCREYGVSARFLADESNSKSMPVLVAAFLMLHDGDQKSATPALRVLGLTEVAIIREYYAVAKAMFRTNLAALNLVERMRRTLYRVSAQGSAPRPIASLIGLSANAQAAGRREALIEQVLCAVISLRCITAEDFRAIGLAKNSGALLVAEMVTEELLYMEKVGKKYRYSITAQGREFVASRQSLAKAKLA